VISANAIIVAWVANLTTKDGTLGQVAIFLPILIAISGYLLSRINIRTSAIIIKYLKLIEESFNKEKGGFGKFFDDETKNAFFGAKRVVTFLYGLQFVLALYFAYRFWSN
jgi:hypothetical protein